MCVSMITVQAVAEFYDSFGWLACGMPELVN